MSAIPARRLNHAVLFVSDVDRAVSFWTSALDMEVISHIPEARAAFLRLTHSSNHHDLGLFGLGADVGKPSGAAIGLYHLAWQVDTVNELADARQTLIDLDAYVGESSHGATKSVYAKDPDGNEFEIMWMLPRHEWGEDANSATIERLDLDGELKRWSGVATAHE